MTSVNNLENFVTHIVERALNGRHSERHALVTSYDPKNYLAKVKFQPYGQQSGWLPIETGHIGKGYGQAFGLQPGDGDGSGGAGGASGGGASGGSGTGSNPMQQSQDSMGDQVICRFMDHDFEAPKIVQRVHSQKDTPPGKVNSGEMMYWTKFKKDKDSGPDAQKDGTGGTGCKVYFKNDGTWNVEDGNGATYVLDGNGNHTITSGNSQKTTKVLHQILQGDAPTSVDDGTSSSGSQQSSQPLHYSQLEKKKGAKTSVFNEQHWTTHDESGVTSSSTNQITLKGANSVTSQAPQIPHIGNSNVTQNLSVGLNVTALGYGTVSDVRLKTKINPLRSVLDGIMRLVVKTFDKKFVDYEPSKPTVSSEPPRSSLGLIAQEVREVFPALVEGGDDEFLTVHESKVAMVLLAAFQEFVKETRQEIAGLKAQLHARPLA